MNFWGKNKQLPKNATSPEITEFLINHNACTESLKNVVKSLLTRFMKKCFTEFPL